MSELPDLNFSISTTEVPDEMEMPSLPEVPEVVRPIVSPLKLPTFKPGGATAMLGSEKPKG